MRDISRVRNGRVLALGDECSLGITSRSGNTGFLRPNVGCASIDGLEACVGLFRTQGEESVTEKQSAKYKFG